MESVEWKQLREAIEIPKISRKMIYDSLERSDAEAESHEKFSDGVDAMFVEELPGELILEILTRMELSSPVAVAFANFVEGIRLGIRLAQGEIK